MWRIHGAAVARSGVLMPLLTTAVLAVGGIRLASGDMSVGDLLAASRYAALAAGVGTAAGLLGSLIRSRSAARRAAELMALPAMTYGARTLPPDGRGTLELRGVSVRREDRTVLAGVDLTIPGGTSVAVVGRSGAGKSTLAAVAGRLTEPDGGPSCWTASRSAPSGGTCCAARSAMPSNAPSSSEPRSARHWRAARRCRRNVSVRRRVRRARTRSYGSFPMVTRHRRRPRPSPGESFNAWAWQGRSRVPDDCWCSTTRRPAWTP